MLWTYANKTERRKYAYVEASGTDIGPSSLRAILFLAPLLSFVLDSFRRGTWVYHGTRDQDVLQYWAIGRTFFRPQHNEILHRWRIVWKLLGKREFEEIVIGGGGWNVFDITRLRWQAVMPEEAGLEEKVDTVVSSLCEHERRIWRSRNAHSEQSATEIVLTY